MILAERKRRSGKKEKEVRRDRQGDRELSSTGLKEADLQRLHKMRRWNYYTSRR
jgi:hypothetical protein